MPPPPRRSLPKKQPVSPGEKARATRSLLFSVPGEHFQLVPAGPALMCVTQVSHAQALRAPLATLTREQLGGLLYENDIPVIKGAALAGYLSSQHTLPGFESRAPGRFSLEPGTSRVSQSAWRGGLGEVSARYSRLLPQQDLNALTYNHAIFDLRDPLGGLNSVKTSVRTSASGGDPFATYRQGLGDILGMRPAALEQARQQLYPHLPRAQGEALIIHHGYLSINEDHVEPFRAVLRDPVSYRRLTYVQLANQLLLKLGPIEVAGKSYEDYAALEQALRRTDNSEAVRRQLEAAMQAVREGLARRVRGNGIATQHITSLFQFRQQIATTNLHLPPARLRQWIFPELLMVARYGGGLGGNLSAARVAGARGAAGGATVSIVLELGHFYYGTQEHDLRVVEAGVAGGVAGWVGGATQSVVMSSAGSALSRSLVTQGLDPRLATATGRGLGGFAAGGLAAPVFAATSLALDDQEHSGTDYAAKGARAFVAGSLSSALSAGAVGAIWGSEVPLAGNIVGFIIGFTGFYAIDTATGEQVEHGVRQTLEGHGGDNR